MKIYSHECTKVAVEDNSDIENGVYVFDFISMTDWYGDKMQLNSDNEWEWWCNEAREWESYHARLLPMIKKAHKYWCDMQAERILLNMDKVSV